MNLEQVDNAIRQALAEQRAALAEDMRNMKAQFDQAMANARVAVDQAQAQVAEAQATAQHHAAQAHATQTAATLSPAASINQRPKLSKIKWPPFSGKEIYEGLGHNFETWFKLFESTIATDVAFHGSKACVSNSTILDMFARHACPAHSNALIARISHLEKQDPRQLDECVQTLIRLTGTGVNFGRRQHFKSPELKGKANIATGIKSNDRRKNGPDRRKQPNGNTYNSKQCFNRGPKEDPTGKTCHFCHAIGHYESDCNKKKATS
ncbi:hypothetical protein DYB28_004686 [Aphanomyces astaci]|uniref:Uncharacterized protein n=1 Tax=Aphanomyces astaci TaxID=112090 RepID=A0A397C3V2_APHAT|nr:hypothetical protein DYB25_004010 [Aphanomyces astaci]RHY38338.1 hypothetical protein DYB38_007242 [Aphanomyces astaci]RHY56415.1 hypothetical protein DYB34_005827 [Aphanomyces astaci]RHY78273.1 hypothetical protein DYB30_007697 [Aphanomyces astaci]RHZ06742.1 hypothetical protein DYB26_004586 [Aphanomyces astaci]